MDLEELIQKFQKWAKEDVVEKRVTNDEDGYSWVAKSIEFSDELELTSIQDFFDRKGKNSEYKSNYEEEDIKGKQPYAWLQAEINAIYGFHKCFAMRNHTRLQLYRNDLSQKGARAYSAIHDAVGVFLHKKEASEQS